MGLILMMMTIGGAALAAVLMVFAAITRRVWLMQFVIGGTLIWFAFYFAVLLAASFRSEDRNLTFDEPKAFCGFYFDCHMHTAVTGVRKTRTIGGKTANGEFYVVEFKVFSDAVRATLGLLTVDAHVVDDENRSYPRDISAEGQLPLQPLFERRIGPGESFEKEIVFDLPVGVLNPRLDIREGYGLDHAIEAFLIDDEDSVFHKRNYFGLQEHEREGAAGVK